MLPKPKIKMAKPATVLSVEDRYKKKEHREHILIRPDTYIGSVEHEETTTWLYDLTEQRMVKKEITYIPGLYKIFDEILVNAIDQFTRMKSYLEIQDLIRAGKAKATAEVSLEQTFRPVRNISVTIDLTQNMISVENDGSGIEVAMHQKEGVYVPELIFGHLLSGENFEDNEKNLAQDKTWGGRNGYGAKLTNIFSQRFEIETVDDVRKLHYHQVFRNNMKEIEKPTVKKYSKVPFTKITFYPDLPLFGLKETIDEGTAGLMIRRVYDTAGWTDQKVNVFLNGEKIPVRSFEKYMDLYLGAKTETKRVFYTSENGRWEIGACVAPEQKFEQVSFVNGIATLRGGKHVDYIVNQITRKMLAQATTKNSTLKAQHIKDNLWVFVKAVIPDPTFDTQTKENMTLAIAKITAKSRCELPDDFITKIAKTGVLERAKQLNVFKDKLDLNKTDGEKRTRCKIPKLDDAHWAGTAKSEQCTLVITEGDSAKTFATSGIAALPVADQQFWGVFPLRGKPLNVREATAKQIATNAEILALKQILGLQQGKDYSQSKSSLRYGRLMILSDSDLDGYHIRGLVINFLHFFWPSLLRRNDFLQAMMTPIVRAWKYHKGAKTVSKKIDQSSLLNFWTEAEYRQWKAEAMQKSDWSQWQIKYYKGLGTSNAQIAKEIFGMKQVVDYTCEVTGQINNELSIDDQIIELAFDKKYSDARKIWLAQHQVDQLIPFKRQQTLSEFVNDELRQFSVEDCARSIPNICDGLKPSQRKILYLILRDNINKEIRVAQLAGFVSAKTGYHHGEASLFEAIIKMAQNFVGSNNINLLYPEGQFGTRRQKGKDSASPRYIHTFKTPIVDALFVKDDAELYDYLDDDGMKVEPRYFVPILPTVLINGASGIGTGYSTDVPGFNPVDIVANLRLLLKNQPIVELKPWIRGFKGTITDNPDKKGAYICRGTWQKTGADQIEILEIPTNLSYESYNEFLEDLLEKKKSETKTGSDKKETPVKKRERILRESIKSVDTSQKPFKPIVNFVKGGLARVEQEIGIDIAFKLTTTINTSNMHLFNAQGQIQKYHSPSEILLDYFPVRLDYYNRRRERQLATLKTELAQVSARLRFVLEVMDEKIVVYRQKRAQIIQQLIQGEYPTINSQNKDTDLDDVDQSEKGYNYLLHMRIESFSEETIAKLEKEKANVLAKVEWLESQTPESLWALDLDNFEKAYKDFEIDWQDCQLESIKTKVNAPTRKVIKQI